MMEHLIGPIGTLIVGALTVVLGYLATKRKTDAVAAKVAITTSAEIAAQLHKSQGEWRDYLTSQLTTCYTKLSACEKERAEDRSKHYTEREADELRFRSLFLEQTELFLKLSKMKRVLAEHKIEVPE